jgi:hypothetical protein
MGKYNTNNLTAPTDLTENPYGKKKLAKNLQKNLQKDATQKSATMVQWGIAIEFVPSWPISVWWLYGARVYRKIQYK